MSGASDTTGFGLSWLAILTYPMLADVQVIRARVGVMTLCGLQELVREGFGRGWRLVLLGSVLCVNVITLGADLEAGAAALGLVFGVGYRWAIAVWLVLSHVVQAVGG